MYIYFVNEAIPSTCVAYSCCMCKIVHNTVYTCRSNGYLYVGLSCLCGKCVLCWFLVHEIMFLFAPQNYSMLFSYTNRFKCRRTGGG